MSRVTCHMSHVFFLCFYLAKWWSLLVEGLLSTGPTPSSFLLKSILSQVMLVSHVLPKKLPNSEHFPHWRQLCPSHKTAYATPWHDACVTTHRYNILVTCWYWPRSGPRYWAPLPPGTWPHWGEGESGDSYSYSYSFTVLQFSVLQFYS